MRLEEFEKQEAERLRKAAEAARKPAAQGGGRPGQPRQPGARRKPGPAKKSPAREWLGTAAWTAASMQGVGLFCTLTLLADAKTLHLRVGRKRLAKLLGCGPATIGRHLLVLEGLGMIRRRCHKQAGAGGVMSILDLWICRPAAIKGERLPGLDASAHGCAPVEKTAKPAPIGAQP